MPQPTTRKAHLDSLAVCLLLACCMFWGFQQVLVKATVAEVAPVFQAFVRFALATVAVAAWCLWRGVRLSMAGEPAGAARAGLLAGALFAGEFACIYLGLQYTTASRLTVFLYGSPFWVALLLPRFVPGERLRGLQWLGLAAAFMGVTWALGDGLWGAARAAQPLAWLGDVLGLVAGLVAAIGAETALAVLQTKVFDFPWEPDWRLWLILPLSGAVLLSLCGGWLGTRLLKGKALFRQFAS